MILYITTSSGPLWLNASNEHFVKNLKKGDKSNGKHHRPNRKRKYEGKAS